MEQNERKNMCTISDGREVSVMGCLKVLNHYIVKKGEFGTAIYNGEKVFYKRNDNILNEFKGYSLIKEKYKVADVVYFDDKIILYKYQDELIKSTLHEYFYFDKKCNVKLILEQYQNSLFDTKLLDESNCSNTKFFKGRINVLKEYLNSDLLVINKIRHIIETTIEKLNEEKEVYCYLTQGDPTDTNVSTNGIFTDFETAGYNSIVGEISIAFASVITHGSYFYPKYNKSAYFIRPKILNIYDSYNPITNQYSILKKNQKYMLAYLDLYRGNSKMEKHLNEYLKYYLCMRLLTPMNILTMEDEDQEIIIKYLNYVFDNIASLDDLYKMIEGGKICC